jgi:serine/threonine protein kinase
MVTTLSALVLKSTTAHLFHIGDSRIYRFREAALEQLTSDHRVWVSEKQNYLSRAMGIDLHLDIDYKTVALEVGDIFFMSTDGVHDFLDAATLRHLLTSSADLNVIADRIVMQALEAGSTDNVTCQLLRIESLPSQLLNEVYNELMRLPFPPPMGPGMTIDGYEIIEEVHASTTSQLYKVRDRDTGEYFMMKTPSVNYSDDPAYIERFYIEEWAGKRLNSEFVIRIIEQKRPRNFLYFIMELVEGITLKQWLLENPSPDFEVVTDITSKIIQGLRVFHRMEMLHRDLKPANVMLTRDGNIKIIDFGSVKIAGIEEISTPVERAELLGTKNYTAPEYLLGMPGSNRSDIFSLGVMVYQMVTGQLPYGEKLSRGLDSRTLNKIHYTSATVHNPMVPLWFDGALEKAVKTDYRQRYDTFSEFLFDLTHPNPLLNKNIAPLLDSHPLLFWRASSILLFISNIILLMLWLSE